MQCRDMTWRMALQEQVTHSGQGLSRTVVALSPYTWERCDWGITHPPASLNNELRLWPPHQPHMEPNPRSSLPNKDYLSLSSPDYHDSYLHVPSLSNFQFFDSIITITSLYIKTYSSYNSPDEDPQIKMFGPLNWSSFLCYVRGHAKITDSQWSL